VLEVRPATPADADALAATVSEGFETYRAFAPEGWEPPDRLELAIGIAVRLRDADQRTWVAVDREDGGAVAGQVAYLPASSSRHPDSDPALAHLGQLFVRRRHWGTGLATRLLNVAIADATARGFTAMRLYTPAGQARARRFYEREGWSLHGKPMHEPSLGLVLVEYRRALPEA
jgi:GNAT superfamily N-acetyltransferase